mmetsp:Transcript_4873/g.14570  ORF Transcript_4873/g.14570 Transcript_4873/m.14570 type:complete len:202 (-) Transcript_4873:1138-1743(-)
MVSFAMSVEFIVMLPSVPLVMLPWTPAMKSFTLSAPAWRVSLTLLTTSFVLSTTLPATSLALSTAPEAVSLALSTAPETASESDCWSLLRPSSLTGSTPPAVSVMVSFAISVVAFMVAFIASVALPSSTTIAGGADSASSPAATPAKATAKMPKAQNIARIPCFLISSPQSLPPFVRTSLSLSLSLLRRRRRRCRRTSPIR